MKNNLHNEMSVIDYIPIITKFLVSNNKNISKIYKNRGKKLHNLILSNSYHNSFTSYNLDKVIFKVMSSTLFKKV